MAKANRSRMVQLRNVSRVQANVKGMAANVAKDKLKRLASIILLAIVTNANKGLNCDNKKMKPYSKMYQRIRAKNNLGPTPNFQFSSNMIRSLQIFEDKLNNLEVSIGVSGVDKDGIPNSVKLRKVQKIKNYFLLKWSKYLSKIVAEFFKEQRRR